MKLSEYNKRAREYTGKASDITRHLIFAGIAIIWIFKKDVDGKTTIDAFLIYPLLLLSFAIICDLLQYVVGGLVWQKFFKINEKIAKKEHKEDTTKPIDPDISTKRELNSGIYFFYYAKIVLLILAYILIISYLTHKLFFN